MTRGRLEDVTGDELAAWLLATRARTDALIWELDETQMFGPKLRRVNPPLWEIGHIAYFYESFYLREHLGQPPVRADSDSLWNSITIEHFARWDLPLPPREGTQAYLKEIQDRILDRLPAGEVDPEEAYLIAWGILHEDMHGEAFAYTRQSLGYPAPSYVQSTPPVATESLEGDAEIPRGTFFLGASGEESFVFDNEKWGQELPFDPFAIARTATTQGQFADFVDAGGYERTELWGEGRDWLESLDRSRPIWWRLGPSGWERRDFDRWVPLERDRVLVHVNHYEAQAYCRWAGRRLPTELEWEVAASGEPGGGKRAYPWGSEAPTAAVANVGGLAGGCADAGALPAGDSPFGCRQMIGNSWEWTSDTFEPFPGFEPDMYADYSQPLFGNTKVLKGGCWVTQPRLIRTAWRNYYERDRSDVWAGFRTCAPR
jgi:iron(II)-dependent oxidoreductase